MPEDLPLPEWPKPSREDGASAEASPFDPVPVNDGSEIAEFRVEAGTQDGDVQVVPVSGQESQGEVLRSIERHLERIVDLLEDMTG